MATAAALPPSATATAAAAAAAVAATDAPVLARALPPAGLAWVQRKLQWMRAEGIWPRAAKHARYLWTDAFGVALLASLFVETGDCAHLDEASWLVDEVMRVLGRKKGVRIGEAPDRDGQYAHYLAMWLSTLALLADVVDARGGGSGLRFRELGLRIAADIHPAFVVRGQGVWWKLEENLSRPHHDGYGFGALDSLDLFVAYRMLDPAGMRLGRETEEVHDILQAQLRRGLNLDQDLSLGMALWLSSAACAKGRDWALDLRSQALAALEGLWQPRKGCFARSSRERGFVLAFGNHGVAIGLAAADVWPERVAKQHAFFETFRSGDKYDCEAITHVMHCCAHLPGVLVHDAHAAISRRVAGFGESRTVTEPCSDAGPPAGATANLTTG